MRKRIPYWISVLCCFLSSIFLFCGCSSFISEPPLLSNPSYYRQHPPLNLPESSDEAEIVFDNGISRIQMNFSNSVKGYMAIRCRSLSIVRLRLTCESTQRVFRLDEKDETQIIPLTLGEGEYLFELFSQIRGTRHKKLMSVSRPVQLENEFSPYLIPHTLIPYDQESEVVELAHSIVQNASTDLEVVQQIYYWVAHHIQYDQLKAEHLRDSCDYTPDLNEIIQQKRGICYDYAVLTAALLRVNGIPCKLIIGMAEREDHSELLHAWNMVWLEESGSICDGFEVEGGHWIQLDLTVAAGCGSIAPDKNIQYIAYSEY